MKVAKLAAAAVALLVALGVCAQVAAAADGVQIEHAFSGYPSDGMAPNGGLTLGSDGVLYGTTNTGTSSLCAPVSAGGDVFGIGQEGGSYSVLHTFFCAAGADDWANPGYDPDAAPIDGGDGFLYGSVPICPYASDGGAVYRMRPDGSDYGFLFCLGGHSGNWYAHPGQLTLASDGRIYGQFTSSPTGCGAVFRLGGPDGYTVVADLCQSGAPDAPRNPVPQAPLVEGPDGSFYGTSKLGGDGSGTVYRVTSDGAVTTLHSFTGSDGAWPEAGLTFGSDGALYGTTANGNDFNNGSVFRITTSGQFSVLSSAGWGRLPSGPVVQAPNGLLLGTTWNGGAYNAGTLFSVDLCGHQTFIHSFAGDQTDGGDVIGDIVIAGSKLWGTTQGYGPGGAGTIWSWPLALVPETVALGSSGGTLTAAVTLAGGQATGTVSFYDGGTLLGTAPLSGGSASISASLGGGDHTLTARYCGLTSDTVDVNVGPPPDDAPPSSSATSPALSSSASFGVGWTASDDGSGVASVELWVKGPADSGYSRVATDSSAATSGTFAFTATEGDGRYDFYTRATDAAGNYEDAPTVADTTTVVDTTPPAITIAVPADGATYVIGQSLTASYACTDAGSGVATCAGPVAVGAAVDTTTPGTHTFTVQATDRVGNSASKTVTYTVAGAPPAYGLFVVGDRSWAPGSSVDFWGAQWWKDNVLSGGTGPAAFKGFADAVSGTPTACGGTWVSRPGSSSAPPATIPRYLTVVVSSSVTKSGSAIGGDVLHVLVVRTDAGYAANPGHPGTGVVVGRVC